nr:hypothetical protein [Rhodopirellula baltica]
MPFSRTLTTFVEIMASISLKRLAVGLVIKLQIWFTRRAASSTTFLTM